MANSSTVKFNNHFKLYILFKDNIIFESELIKNNIDYFLDNNQVGSLEQLRYFLLDNDRLKIDEILNKESIVASVESLDIIDYKQVKKVQFIYLKVAVIVALLFVLITLIVSYNKC